MTLKERWKDWSYVKKGIVIGGVIGLINIICGSIILFMNLNPGIIISILNSIFILIYVSILMICLGRLHSPYENICDYLPFIIGFILTIIIFSLIGALIGGIYGKIKSRNNQITT